MSLFDKYKSLSAQYDAILSAGGDPFGVCMDEVVSATRARVGGREIVLAGTNNYLGLTFDPACVEAACEATRREGTGTTGSRFANGTYGSHRKLERVLGDFLGFAHCVVFSTGYQANLGAISGLAGADDVILLDADSHACIYDGCRLSAATTVRFRHNSPEDLDKRLSRLGPEVKGKLVIVEGIYSMFGDVAPLAELVDVTKSHGGYIYVDEAHSFGVFGEGGRGVAEAQGVLDKVDFYAGTFSKSLASIGGYCASNHPEFELLRCVMRPYMFTASLSPANVAGVAAAVGEIARRDELRKQIWQNSRRLHKGLTEQGFDICAPAGPIIAIRMPDVETAVLRWNRLLEEGVYANLAIPPGTPNNTSLIRLSVSAAHTPDDIDFICNALARTQNAAPDMAVATT
ncbi:MAG: pyridoxal phosphate-dependent aminotransferase family protein [Parvularculaceae bacterium]